MWCMICFLIFPSRFFVYLSKEGERAKFDLNFATHEARKCADFLSQAQHHLSRARKVDDEERMMRESQEKARGELAKKQQEEEVCVCLGVGVGGQVTISAHQCL